MPTPLFLTFRVHQSTDLFRPTKPSGHRLHAHLFPLSPKGGTRQPRQLANGCTIFVWEGNVCALEHKQVRAPRKPRTSENSYSTHFGE